MRRYLLAAAAAAAIATPAVARDHSGYFGVDAGVMWAKSGLHIDATQSYYCSLGYFDYYFGSCSFGVGNKSKMGYDIDAVAGYDFGMFRLEGEVAYKHAKHKSQSFSNTTGAINVGGKTTNWSGMINGLVDFGDDNGFNFSVGGGVGYAHTKMNFDFHAASSSTGDYYYYFDNFHTSVSKSKFAWQLLAEARYPISPQVDIGLKYRYFNAGKIRRSFLDLDGDTIFASAKFHSHSIMASLIYNFSPPPPPPPPPPPAAAASAASGDADVSGWIGDRGYGDLSGTTTAAASAASASNGEG